VPTYRLYGVTLACDRPLAHRLAPGTGSPDLSLTFEDASRACPHGPHEGPVYTSPHRTEADDPVLRLSRAPSCDLLYFAGVGAFHVGARQIVCRTATPAHPYIPIHFLGTVMAFWLERAGFLTLHASAIVLPSGRAIGFLSDSGSGKSALAAQFLLAGDALLTDDILVLDQRGDRLTGRPGYPQMRLWPDQADHFLGSHEHLDLVDPALAKRRVPVGDGGFGRFHDEPAPLARLYLTERQPPDVEGVSIEDVPPARAAVDLVRHTFSFRIVEALGWQPRRMGQIANAVRAVPVRRLRYPTGYDHLAQVRERLLHDAEG
jgi:hypothetical protein